MMAVYTQGYDPVSYTHLDVYKRQVAVQWIAVGVGIAGSEDEGEIDLVIQSRHLWFCMSLVRAYALLSCFLLVCSAV